MKITDLLKIESIDVNANVASYDEAINHLIDLMMKTGNISNRNLYQEAIYKREQLSSTAVAKDIAIPHGQSEAVKQATIVAMVVKDGVDFKAPDGNKSKLFFMIAASVDKANVHLQALAKLAGLLMEESFVADLIQAPDAKTFYDLIINKEMTLDNPQEEQSSYDLLAVTACPTGIAHTYMAAKSLQQAASKLNLNIKVETNGASGIDNLLTKEEIAQAKGIIVAADRQVEMARFENKPIVICNVAKAIKEPEYLLTKALSDDIDVYHHENKQTVIKTSKLRQFYNYLGEALNQTLPILIAIGALLSIPIFIQEYGLFNFKTFYDNMWLSQMYLAGTVLQISVTALFSGYLAQAIAAKPGFSVGLVGGIGMSLNSNYLQDSNNPGLLGAIIIGFIAGYLVLGIKKLWSKLPESLNSLSVMVIYPIFVSIIVFLVAILISPYIGAINQIIAVTLSSLPIIGNLCLGIILGVMMIVDMGGPVNKTAYLLAISQVLEGNYTLMAAVMAAGMVPPLMVAIATTIFKPKFTENQRKLGKTNYLNGLMFISEGALPFVSGYRFIFMLAAAITGGFSMLYNCGVALVHGGIFVLPLVIHPLRYLVAILAGSCCGAMVYGIFKEKGK
ncbi:MAG: fructose-specific PTS transporter subunit EIIC [Thomasclavelia sp.]